MVNDLHNALYESRVMHHRLAPREHRFDYRVFYLWLDLDELDALHGSLRFFSRNRWNVFSFFDRDHLDLGKANVKENLLAWLMLQGVDTREVARVQLLTFPRVFGYIFNPVCFYYCYNSSGEPLYAVAEVTNTFRELKPYLLRERDAQGRFKLVTPKHFYVSPFSAADIDFDFKLQVPGAKLNIQINDREGDRRLLLSSLSGERRQLTETRLLWYTLKYPVLTLRVILLIHWHAILLWLKRIPVHRKDAHPELQRDGFKPQQSLGNPPNP